MAPKTTAHDPVEAVSVNRPRRRRWLFTAVGGAVAGFTASKLATPTNAEAANGEEIHVGGDHSGNQTTRLTMTNGGSQIGLQVTHTAVPDGFALGNTAILGIGQGIAGAGVSGRSTHTGVRGEGDSVGVEGTSSEGRGVRGITHGSGPALFPAAGGRFETFAGNSIGAHALVNEPGFGQPPPTGSVALLAEAPSGNVAARFIGPVQFLGNLDLVGDFDLEGTLLARSAPGGGPAARFEGVTDFVAAAGGTAARFVGSVEVEGAILQSITPPGGAPPVQSFAVQSLSPWIEDFGGASMAGMAQIRVDLRPQFIAVADVSNYHVFIQAVGGDTPQVAQKDATGFTVNAQNANKAPESISYRLVAPPR